MEGCVRELISETGHICNMALTRPGTSPCGLEVSEGLEVLESRWRVVGVSLISDNGRYFRWCSLWPRSTRPGKFSLFSGRLVNWDAWELPFNTASTMEANSTARVNGICCIARQDPSSVMPLPAADDHPPLPTYRPLFHTLCTPRPPISFFSSPTYFGFMVKGPSPA